MKTWWRIIAGIAAGAANSFAGGANVKTTLVSVALAAMGLISHLSSTSDPTTITGTKSGS